MSVATSHLIEYLLAVRRKGGGNICRFGGIQTTVPIFPPNFGITYQTFPEFTSYATILFYSRFSPDIVPESFALTVSHTGMEVLAGTLNTLQIAEGFNFMIELRRDQPVTSNFTNISGLNQFLDEMDFYLLMDSEEDLKEVRDIINRWGVSSRQEELMAENNKLLRELITDIRSTSLYSGARR